MFTAIGENLFHTLTARTKGGRRRVGGGGGGGGWELERCCGDAGVHAVVEI